MEKKAIFGITAVITTGVLLALALVIAVVFGGATLLTWILSKTVFYLAGMAMIIGGIVLFTQGKIMPYWFWLIAGGLVILPCLFTLQGATLGVILG